MVRSRRSLCPTLALAALLAALVPSVGRAQLVATAVGTGSVSVQSTLLARIPYLLGLNAVGSARVVEQNGDYTTVEIRLAAASNVRWRLEVRSEAGEIEVRSETGGWHRANKGSAAVQVIRSADPTNPREVVVQLRVRGGAEVLQAARARMALRPADAAQGAVSVNWTGSE